MGRKSIRRQACLACQGNSLGVMATIKGRRAGRSCRMCYYFDKAPTSHQGLDHRAAGQDANCRSRHEGSIHVSSDDGWAYAVAEGDEGP